MIQRIAFGIMLSFICSNCTYAYIWYFAPGLMYETVKVDKLGYEGFSPQIALGMNNNPIDIGDYGLYFAGEIFYNPISIKTHKSHPEIANLKTMYSYGISVLPGIYLDSMVLAYIRAGSIWTNFDDFGTKQAYQFGVGMELSITPNWTARGEVSYSEYCGSGGMKNYFYLIGLVYRMC